MPHEQVDLHTFLSEGLPPRDQAPGHEEPPEPEMVEHPLIPAGTVEARRYQLELAEAALEAPSLVVLPTGLGKTIVALFAAADVLQDEPGKVLFLAPTRPLVQQHADTFADFLLVEPQVTIGGGVSPDKRAELFDQARVIFSTPQGLRNDLEDGRISLEDVALLVVDEAHRAVGDYAYVEIGRRFWEDNPGGHLMALTASPGGDEERIEEVRENLGITHVEGRGPEDPEVARYIKDTQVRWVRVPLTPTLEAVRARLQKVVDDRAAPLKKARVLPPKPYVGRKDCIEAGNKIRAQLNRARNKGPLFGMLLNQGVVMQALHALELAETQGIEPLRDFLLRLMRDPGSKSAKAFAGEPLVVEVLERIKDWQEASHPKVEALVKVLERELDEHPESLVIVFAQYRDTIGSIVRALDEAGIPAERFVGQGDREGDKGMSQDEQREVLERLRDHAFKVLVASSVAEEGLDIPSVDLVVFYEPVPSEIRLIQRRGRTGRHRVGRMVVLIAEDTRDEAFMYAAMNREKKMRRLVREMG